MTKGNNKKGGGAIIVATLALGAAFIAGGTVGVLHGEPTSSSHASSQSTLRDLDGREIAVEGSSIPTADQVRRMHVVEPQDQVAEKVSPVSEFRVQSGTETAVEKNADSTVTKSTESNQESGRLIAPDLGLNVGLGTMSAVDGEVTPPGFRSAYRIRNLGSPDGRVFIATHSVRDGRAPGNYLVNAKPGQEVIADGVKYVIDSVERIDKSALASDKEVWADEPGTLAIITCQQRTQGKSVQNIVVIAHKVS